MWDYYAELLPLTTSANNSPRKHSLYRGWGELSARLCMVQSKNNQCENIELIHDVAQRVQLTETCRLNDRA